MSTSNRIIKPGYEFYQPVIAARQVGLRQVPPHIEERERGPAGKEELGRRGPCGRERGEGSWAKERKWLPFLFLFLLSFSFLYSNQPNNSFEFK
jgi:hypothetical protein